MYVRTSKFEAGEYKKKKEKKKKKKEKKKRRGTRDWTRDARSDAVINNSATRCRREFSGVDSTEKNSDSPGGKKATGENGSLKKKKEKKKREREKRKKKWTDASGIEPRTGSKKNNGARRGPISQYDPEKSRSISHQRCRAEKEIGQLLTCIYLPIIKAFISPGAPSAVPPRSINQRFQNIEKKKKKKRKKGEPMNGIKIDIYTGRHGESSNPDPASSSADGTISFCDCREIGLSSPFLLPPARREEKERKRKRERAARTATIGVNLPKYIAALVTRRA